MASEGAEIYLTRRTRGLGKLHHKPMVIGEQVIIAGSFNYTAPATALNDENIVMIGDLSEEDPSKIAIQKRLGAFVLTEIDRMIQENGKSVT